MMMMMMMMMMMIMMLLLLLLMMMMMMEMEMEVEMEMMMEEEVEMEMTMMIFLDEDGWNGVYNVIILQKNTHKAEMERHLDMATQSHEVFRISFSSFSLPPPFPPPSLCLHAPAPTPALARLVCFSSSC